jgi:hypothetical protein
MEEAKKGNVAVIAVIAVVVVATLGVFGWIFAKKAQAPVAEQPIASQPAPVKNVQQQSEAKPLDSPVPAQPVVLPVVEQQGKSSIVYTNSKFGFQVTMPASWTKYTVREKLINLESTTSLYRSTGEYAIGFYLPCKLTRSAGYARNFNDNNFSIWFIRAVPIEDYRDNVCDDESGTCEDDVVLGKNGKYVFLGGKNDMALTIARGECKSFEGEENKDWNYLCDVFEKWSDIPATFKVIE